MYFKTRALLTKVDLEFISQSLGGTAAEREAILQIAGEPDTVTQLLHDPRLFQRTTTVPPVFLTLSPHLYFYLFVYRALEHKHIADDDLVDYVAGVCVEFRSAGSFWQLSSRGDKTVYAVDLMNLLGEVDKHRQYYLRRFIGNVSLFLTGFFPDFIVQRNRKQGAPPMRYYEAIGRSQYETAASDSPAYDADAAPVLSTLAERFVEIRSAINVYTDAYLSLNNQKRSIEIIERQAATLDEESFRQSLEL
jgi:hypothetical protein